MKPMRKLIKEITGPTGPYTIKAKIIKNKNVYSAEEGRPLLYQKITFQDEEGTKMKTTLYQEELEVFDGMFQDNMLYDISNAKVKKRNDQLSMEPSYNIEFNINTIIQPIVSHEESVKPNYQLIASIPRTLILDNHYDILGVVIYVDKRCQIPIHNGHILDVRDVVVIDNSHDQVLTVTVTDKLAIHDGETMASIAESLPIVGFTALRSSYQRGFTLSTTYSSSIIFEPLGTAANALRAWTSDNIGLLMTKKHQVSQVRTPQLGRTLTTISHILAKKPNNTLQEEHHWLQVRLAKFKSQNVHLYLGCSNCGTGCDIEDVGVPYTCNACIREEVVATPRMAVTFGASDETGYYTFTAFTENAERLLEIKATTLYSMLPQEKRDCLARIVDKMQATPYYIQVAPVTSLSYNQSLRWVLRHVSLV